jgi:dihydropteroate synthase
MAGGGTVKIMGIVNLSHDSFFADSVAAGVEDALARVEA